MASTLPVPLERAYWVEPGRLLAGAYPGDLNPDEARAKIQALLHAGIRTFINLMEEHEVNWDGEPFAPYQPLVQEYARELDVETACLHLAIPDTDVPSPDYMTEIQATIDESLAQDRPVYVHCWGGRGRTGIVVAVYLIRKGLATADDFLDVLGHLRAHDPSSGHSPENQHQADFVRRYAAEHFPHR
ncbi:MAG: protein-tyrosine phosphatase family protein [Planctomycetota bacterium]|jgi:hypothetical protein